jgi:two-component system KDP operon response regulator KdpE
VNPARPAGGGRRVLVVDDEPQILRAMRINLRARGYDVAVAGTGAAALAEAARLPPDVVLLDLGLPDMDGVDVIHGLRGWTQVPIVVLSGRTQSRDKVDALDAGADDYVTKPFGMDELLARLRAVSRRGATAATSPSASLGEWTIDLAARTVTRHASEALSERPSQVHLTKTEWRILDVLVRNPGRLVTGRQLLQEVWGPAYGDQMHYLRTYLNRLRHKLEPDPSRPRHLVTEPGMGYRFQP